MSQITIKQSKSSKFFKDVYVNGKCIGKVMANDSMTPIDCYEALKNNWEIDRMEMANDIAINNNLNY